MIKLRKSNILLITGAAILLFSNFAAADYGQKNSKPIVKDESQSLSAPAAPSTESPHGISESRDDKGGNLSSPAPSGAPNNNAPGEEKHKPSTGSHPKHY